MTEEQRKSPEQWEAGDMIEALKSGLPVPGDVSVPPPNTCPIHPGMASSVNTLKWAVIWIIRHMALWKNGVQVNQTNASGGEQDALEIGKVYVRAHGSKALTVLAILAAVWYLKATRTEQPTMEDMQRMMRHEIRAALSQADGPDAPLAAVPKEPTGTKVLHDGAWTGTVQDQEAKP